MMSNPKWSIDVGSALQPCPLKKRTHWIEIELVGEDNQPLPFIEYRVKLPEGKVANGYLDRNGFARLDGITQPGTCLVCFPALDEQAWTFLESFADPAALGNSEDMHNA
jgi:hypothetical protein